MFKCGAPQRRELIVGSIKMISAIEHPGDLLDSADDTGNEDDQEETFKPDWTGDYDRLERDDYPHCATRAALISARINYYKRYYSRYSRYRTKKGRSSCVPLEQWFPTKWIYPKHDVFSAVTTRVFRIYRHLFAEYSHARDVDKLHALQRSVAYFEGRRYKYGEGGYGRDSRLAIASFKKGAHFGSAFCKYELIKYQAEYDQSAIPKELDLFFRQLLADPDMTIQHEIVPDGILQEYALIPAVACQLAKYHFTNRTSIVNLARYTLSLFYDLNPVPGPEHDWYICRTEGHSPNVWYYDTLRFYLLILRVYGIVDLCEPFEKIEDRGPRTQGWMSFPGLSADTWRDISIAFFRQVFLDMEDEAYIPFVVGWLGDWSTSPLQYCRENAYLFTDLSTHLYTNPLQDLQYVIGNEFEAIVSSDEMAAHPIEAMFMAGLYAIYHNIQTMNHDLMIEFKDGVIGGCRKAMQYFDYCVRALQRQSKEAYFLKGVSMAIAEMNGSTQDQQHAVSCLVQSYDRSTNKTRSPAAVCIAFAYLGGYGVERDVYSARYWFETQDAQFLKSLKISDNIWCSWALKPADQVAMKSISWIKTHMGVRHDVSGLLHDLELPAGNDGGV
ncbi:uncharacterized protein BJ171DRAFT_535619 [Polychytrium aggregatum]|uniref:uncharacterized protein n=1 Tax=Polychytrium aggregatum TaxID=110093 RepID=UPI0022FF05FE|nr:uncharacterized protein BJ171DRAFT_535619 [Polychytrium aggregatum]KAI9192980.1 hypothetical protein BJ171DRAFT_535619 [Polychytrium aggregatum]